jgi:hypothetical protein
MRWLLLSDLPLKYWDLELNELTERGDLNGEQGDAVLSDDKQTK